MSSPFTHGVYPEIEPTGLVTIVKANSAAIVAVGTAPVHRLSVASYAAGAYKAYVNTPLLCLSIIDAEANLGTSEYESAWSLAKCVAGFFVYAGVSPVIFINVYDPFVHSTPATYTSTVSGSTAPIPVEIVAASLVVKNGAGSTTYVEGTDYLFSYNDDWTGTLTLLTTGILAQATLSLAYDTPNPSAITDTDIIGGVDSSGNYTGLECIELVFSKTSIVPGLLIAPDWSYNPTVAAVIKARTYNINNQFSCDGITELDSVSTTSLAAAVTWKSTNNYVDPQLQAIWPCGSLGGQLFAPEIPRCVAIVQTDAKYNGIPYVSSSNKSTFIDSVVLRGTGAEFDITDDGGVYLNSNGISTFINYGNGWKTWGNRQSCYGPEGDTDPIDMWENVRRMAMWLGNTWVLTLKQFVDGPGNAAGVDSVVETINQFLNSLASPGVSALLPGANCKFVPNNNQLINILDGIFIFNTAYAVPIPMETLIVQQQYDTTQLANFIAQVGLAA
jgi:phage tail sheath protein FI